jgi:hypothetical protein
MGARGPSFVAAGAPQSPRSSALGLVVLTAPARCRCGAVLGPNTPAHQFSAPPAILAGILMPQAFCGPACARAFILEALEFTVGPAAASTLADREDLAGALRLQLALLTLS